MKIQRLYRALQYFLLLFTSSACDPCNSPEIPFTFNSTETNLLNNAGDWLQVAASDTLYNEAIAFRVIIKDSIFPAYAHQKNKTSPLQLIPRAQAEECPQLFVPLNRIEGITITTLLPITENIQTNTQVTDLFYSLTGASYYSEHLYHTINQTVQNHQTREYFEYQQEEISFFLSFPVLMKKAQFQIDFVMSDGSILSTQTPIINIISEEK